MSGHIKMDNLCRNSYKGLSKGLFIKGEVYDCEWQWALIVPILSFLLGNCSREYYWECFSVNDPRSYQWYLISIKRNTEIVAICSSNT